VGNKDDIKTLKTIIYLYQMRIITCSTCFSYCELCKEPFSSKCSSCGFVTEETVHVDCLNANSLVKEEDEGIDKKDDSSSKTTAESPKKQATI
jgi:hypothetical protein